VEDRVVNQLVVPSGLVGHVLRSLHNNMEHLRRENILGLVRNRFFWPGQYKDVENWIGDCRRCILRKTPAQDKVELSKIVTSQPLELVCMDFLCLERSKG
jgi:hypothetical protein